MKWQIKFIFKWYDLWIGLFIDKPKNRLYLFYLPMCGILIEWESPVKKNTCTVCGKELSEAAGNICLLCWRDVLLKQ